MGTSTFQNHPRSLSRGEKAASRVRVVDRCQVRKEQVDMQMKLSSLNSLPVAAWSGRGTRFHESSIQLQHDVLLR